MTARSDLWNRAPELALLVDAIAALPSTAATAAVLGALNDAAATGVVTTTDTGMAYIKQLVTELQVVDGLVDTIKANVDLAVYPVGAELNFLTTANFNQAAASYDRATVTGTGAKIKVLDVVYQMPDEAAGGAFTSFSCQTDHSTAVTFITSGDGAVGNCTAQAQIASSLAAPVYMAEGDKIQDTIGGGAHGSAYVPVVLIVYVPLVVGSHLA